MSDERERIEELRSDLSRSQTVEELREQLLVLAPSFHEAIQKSQMLGQRDDLGMRVISLEMPYMGLAALGKSEPLVAVQKHRDHIRRRQTLAHECAHGLLRDVDRSRIGLDRRCEDRLCSEFARHALMPNDRVEEHLQQYGFPLDICGLQQFCRAFKVGFRPAIRALNEHAKEFCPVVLIAATYRSHRNRPHEFGFRIDAAASDPLLFAPPERRLSSIGLAGLARWALWAEPGSRLSLESDWVALRSRSKTVECWYGPANLEAKVIRCEPRSSPKERGLLIALDRTSLGRMSWDPTKVYAPARVSAPLHPEQISLAR